MWTCRNRSTSPRSCGWTIAPAAFNLLNRVRFGTGSGSLDSLTYGKVTDPANSARQMQMALKLYW